ncbi:MAG: GDP-mannose 4,6-dehydratase, partial [Salinisphaeraceae bacterium]|nr:GDP-mannose 4,6-dehydratase [Salinisphaeraceae bacterium]
MRKILVTGGAGFIGSAVIRHLIGNTDYQVLNLDALTYAGNLESLADVVDSPCYEFQQLDIRHRSAIVDCIRGFKPDAIMHLAAESHVDRSIDGPMVFVETNVLGTANLLDVATEYWRELAGS